MSEIIEQLTQLLENSERLCKERGSWVEPDPELKGIVLDNKARDRVHSGQAVVIGRLKVHEIIAALSAAEGEIARKNAGLVEARWLCDQAIRHGLSGFTKKQTGEIVDAHSSMKIIDAAIQPSVTKP
jgi:hypothetical protein